MGNDRGFCIHRVCASQLLRSIANAPWHPPRLCHNSDETAGDWCTGIDLKTNCSKIRVSSHLWQGQAQSAPWFDRLCPSRAEGHHNRHIPEHIPHKASPFISLDCVECQSTQEVFILPPHQEERKRKSRRERETEMKNTRGLTAALRSRPLYKNTRHFEYQIVSNLNVIHFLYEGIVTIFNHNKFSIYIK